MVTAIRHNQNSGGNVGHQGLEVNRTAKGAIRKLIFSTVAANARQCYRIVFDLETNSTAFSVYNSSYVNVDEFAKPIAEVDEFDSIVIDLMVAMLPSWMLYKHRPRDSANGCFAVA